MIAKVATAALLGIDAFTIELEVDLARSGMPAFIMVGLAEGAVRAMAPRRFLPRPVPPDAVLETP